jgi:hypothetical protein
MIARAARGRAICGRESAVLLISEVELAEGVDADAFGDFFRNEFLPSVRTGPTRAGQVRGVELIERETSETQRVFALLVRWSGVPGGGLHLRSEDEAVQQRFEELAPTVHEPVVWQEVAGRLERSA